MTNEAKAPVVVAMASPQPVEYSELLDTLLSVCDGIDAITEKIDAVMAKLDEQEEAIDEFAEEIQEALYNDKYSAEE